MGSKIKPLVLRCIVTDAGDHDKQFKGSEITITNPFGMWSGDDINNVPVDEMTMKWLPAGAQY